MKVNELQRSDFCWTNPDPEFQCFVVVQTLAYFELLCQLGMENCMDNTLGQYSMWEWN
jgi:hypothetical protein